MQAEKRQDQQSNRPQEMLISVTVSDMGKATDFYAKAFGFVLADQRLCDILQKKGITTIGKMVFEKTGFMLFTEGAFGRPGKTPANTGVANPTSFQVYTRDVDALYKRALQAGAKEVQAPEDMFWGDRVFRVADPDGNVWAFGQRFEKFDEDKLLEAVGG